MVKLIVHVGYGKTGSSSIQKSLLHARPNLLEHGINYLGMMLEHGQNEKRPSWQRREGSDKFFLTTPREQAISELHDVLGRSVDSLVSSGIQTAIWSNEWMLSRPERLIPAIQRIKSDGHDIRIICYIRRHDKWVQSAYAQWGLKHKSYRGPTEDFKTWLKKQNPLDTQFASLISPWYQAFNSDLEVYNFDAVDDVVQHFAGISGISGIETINDNIAPSPVTTAVQAVYNSRIHDTVLPTAFDQIMDFISSGDQNKVYLPSLDKLAPTQSQLREFVESRLDDIAKVNSYLVLNGEDPLDFESPPKAQTVPTSWEVEQFLLKFAFQLHEEVESLRREIKQLNDRLRDAERRP